MAASGGIILSCLNTINRFSACSGIFPGALSQVRHYAARKGTREKAKKKKVKKEVKKLTFAEKVKRSKKVVIAKPDTIKYDDSKKPIAVDDVYYGRHFKWNIYPFAEAIQCHREYFHPTMYDMPNALVNVFVELNMQGVKKTKPVDPFHKIISVKHSFDHGEERNILVFCKEEGQVKEALDGGAALVGGLDIIKLIMSGEVSLHNYDTVIAHPNMMPEVLTLRGLLKRKHPSIKGGTLGPDIKGMLYTQLHGIKYNVKAYDHYPLYGHATIPIGKLNMEIEHLEANLQETVDSIMSSKPKRPGIFITRIRVQCPPSLEKFKIDQKLYTGEEEEPEVEQKDEDDDDDKDDDEETAVAVSV